MFQSVSCHHYPVQHAYGVRITERVGASNAASTCRKVKAGPSLLPHLLSVAATVRVQNCGQVYLPIYVDMLGYLEGHHLTTMCGIICVCRS